MAEDFKISIGVTGEGGGTQGAKGTESSMAFGVSKGLKMAGVIGLLSGLKIVTDTIGVVMQLVSVGIVQVVGLIGGLLGLFISKVVGFFEDPTRYLLQFAVFLINGIISGLETGLNRVVGAINLVVKGINMLIPFGDPISTMDSFELPRYQSDMVLSAYDEYKETVSELASEGRLVSKDAFNASIKFINDLGKSFMKNSEYQELLQEKAQDAQKSEEEALQKKQELAELLKDNSLSSNIEINNGFGVFNEFIRNFKKKAEEANKNMGGGAIRFRQSQANIDYGNATMQSTTLTEKQASSGLYLLNKLGGQ